MHKAIMLLLTLACAQAIAGEPAPVAFNATTPDGLSAALSDILADAIPRQYEKKVDWERKKRITTGLKTEDGKFNLKIHRRKKEVNHGTWKHYRVTMVEPEKNMQLEITDLRSLEAGRIAFTCSFESRLEGWAQARVYNRGIHFITLTAEGNTKLRLRLDCEVGLSLEKATMLAGVGIHPKIVNAHLDLDDFDLNRVSKIRGALAHELGDGLRYLIEEELEGKKLVRKLNRAIEKKKDKLRVSPDKLLGLGRSGKVR